MNLLKHSVAPLRDCVVLSCAIFSLLGCNSATPTPAASKFPQKSVASAKNGVGPNIDLNCVINHIQNPPESFHYSFKVQSDNPWQEDAEVTPQSIDGTFMNNSVPTPQRFHGTPQETSSNLMAIGRMASLFATVRSTSAVINQGPETGVNSYDTIKYSIDTARGTATEQALFKSILGTGGSEKGIVWVTSEGCPVRIVLDEELHSNDGAVLGKAHYEEAMVKK